MTCFIPCIIVSTCVMIEKPPSFYCRSIRKKKSLSGTKYQPLIVFSVYTNGKKLFQCANSKSSSSIFECLNGIRALSVMWIVIVHNFMQYKHNTIAMNEVRVTISNSILNSLHLILGIKYLNFSLSKPIAARST